MEQFGSLLSGDGVSAREQLDCHIEATLARLGDGFSAASSRAPSKKPKR
jgi:hypothetical protein